MLEALKSSSPRFRVQSPFLQSLRSDEDRGLFEKEYLKRIDKAFVRRPDGRVLFPFRRLFIVARARG